MRNILIALSISAAQLGLALFSSSSTGLSEKYYSYFRADALWYESIVDRGYVSTIPPTPQNKETSNVAFFPAYPKLGAVVKAFTASSTQTALLLTAQLMNVLFWIYVLAFMNRWRLSPAAQALTALLIAAHPATFYTVSAYSESTFLASLLGFLFFATRLGPDIHSRKDMVLAVVHGIGVTAGRIVGPLCVLAPLVRSRSRATFVVCTLATLGIGAFYAYCHFKFGVWDLYVQTQTTGWGHTPDLFGFWKPHKLIFQMPEWHSPWSVGLILTNLTWFGVFAIAAIEGFLFYRVGKASKALERLPLYAAAFFTFYISLGGTANSQFVSMLRYHLASYALLILSLSHLITSNATPLTRASRHEWIRAVFVLLLISTAFIGFYLQSHFANLFSRDLWVS